MRKDALPTVATYDCRPFYWGNEEGCTFSAPSPGTWYIGLYTWDPYTGVTLTATVTGGGPSSGTLFNLISPCRVIDSRATTALEAGGTRTIAIGGSCGIPADAVAVAANITAVTPAQDGWFALYRAGTAWSGTSTLNFRRNRTRANSAILPLSQDGKVEIRNGGIAATQFIIDVSGYFR